MTALTANRRAITSVCRAQSSRLVYPSSSIHPPALSTSALAGQEVEEITLQPIFDICDAPTRLAESSEFIRDKYKSSSAMKTFDSSSAFTTPNTTPAPAALPPPITFDGPARPRNAAFALQSRLRQAGLTPAPPARRRTTSGTSRTFSSSEPLIQVFEGPAKITRYHHQHAGEKEGHSTKYLVAVGVAGAVGCATLAKDDERLQ
ncbi:hypothetical protein NLJ89_g7796 [Agrocybe chaxingu]|uniref:Uncharacterized protein n=1 Tax=Agrocybe chaxingu TaxID=84603 RepID=A0A9W8JVN5_9AGAR|nr:hypothetical protein NLJ89_g7796 [Agrocybe chaxingu]